MLLAHAPAGYLLTRFLTRSVFKNAIDPKRSDRFYQIIIAAGVIGAILPDFDFIYNLFFDPSRTPHHQYITHMPVFWLLLMLFSVIAGRMLKMPRLTIVALTVNLSALAHLVCDTITAEIYWFYPLSSRGFNIFTVSQIHIWWVQNYLSHWTFLIEIVIVSVAMAVFLRVKETTIILTCLLKQSVKFKTILIRLAICLTAIAAIFLVGSLCFDIDNRIMNKLVAIKYRVITTAYSL